MHVTINGLPRGFSQLAPGAHLSDLIEALGLKGDRIAVEYNGAIVPRTEWSGTPLADGDKLEIVHFVGGGRDESSYTLEPY